ncbi:MAG: DUF5343 domain-containing protein [Sedimentisphaerales bacterium]|jgi:hypothetical protein
MVNTHPYISGAGNISQMIGHLRKSFPENISSDTVKKLGLAPNNESYVINVLQFIGVINEEGKKTPEAAKVFANHRDEDFSKSFGELVQKAYSALFELHSDSTWNLSDDDLITFFRQSDQTSATIGKRQASTFKILASLAGHGELPASKPGKTKSAPNANKEGKKQTVKPKETRSPNLSGPTGSGPSKDVGLTVRIEINLPADGTKETYDNIFKSIKENLLDA